MPLNPDVTKFLDEANHPLRAEIDALRTTVAQASDRLNEHIKWNGPNFSVGQEDRITIKIFPPKLVQIIFHRGAKVLKQPEEKLIADPSGMLEWKGNDRAVATFKNMEAITGKEAALTRIVQEWITATEVH